MSMYLISLLFVVTIFRRHSGMMAEVYTSKCRGISLARVLCRRTCYILRAQLNQT